MTQDEAARLLEPAVAVRGGRWLDLGAGIGTFSLALARLLGEGGSVVAVDVDRAALNELASRSAELPPHWGRVDTVAGDIRHVGAVPGLQPGAFGGALMANVLHYVEDPAAVLRSVTGLLAGGGRMVVVEYQRVAADPWVPHPLPLERLETVSRLAGSGAPRVVGWHASRFGGRLYCAVLEVGVSGAAPGRR